MRTSQHRSAVRIALLTLVGVLAMPLHPAQAAAQNGRIAYTHPTGFFTDAEVFAINPDGTGKRRLTDNGRNDFNPAWAPDGQAIVYESSTDTDIDLYILDRTGERNLTNDEGRANRFPAWSPDGTQIAFARQNPFTLEGAIWVIDVDGTKPRAITDTAGENTTPTWSPDGRFIMFVSDRTGNHDLFVVRSDGTGLRQVTDTPGVQEANPDWSPDGRRIAYDVCRSTTYPCAGVTPNFEIMTARPDGSNRQRLTFVEGIDTNPSWSPDGTQLVFHSSRAGFSHLWTMDADGSNQTQLTFGDFRGGVDPDWGPLP
ncbi:hypothetical protein BH20ACT5_BH20ACT5_01660 [soil metagenome]